MKTEYLRIWNGSKWERVAIRYYLAILILAFLPANAQDIPILQPGGNQVTVSTAAALALGVEGRESRASTRGEGLMPPL